MGSFFDIGCKPYNNNYGERGLTVGLNRTASNALEALFDDALQECHPDIHEKIMMFLPLDQISFSELSKEEFNMAIKTIRQCLFARKEPNEVQLYQQDIWNTEILPLMMQDERYQPD